MALVGRSKFYEPCKYFSNLMEPVPLSEVQMAVVTASPLQGWG